MSIDNDDNLGVAQTIGQLRLQIEERETRSDRVKRSELDAANADLLAFGLKLAAKDKEIESLNATIHALRMSAKTARETPTTGRKAVVSSAEVALREENVALESQLRAAHVQSDEYRRRIARLEAATKAIPSLDAGELGRVKEQAAEYKRHIERLEADVFLLKERNRNQADMLAAVRDIEGKLAEAHQRIRDLEHRPPEVVVKPAPATSECQTCTPIIRAIAQAIVHVPITSPTLVQPATLTAPEKPSEMLPARKPTSIREKILYALAEAEAPATAAQIGERIGIPGQTVQQNIYHSVRRREVTRLEPTSKQGELDMRSFRYWLASRPLPREATA